MEVVKTRTVDCSDKNEDGHFDWHYEYDLYEFDFGQVKLHARSYSDTPNEVHIFAYEKNNKRTVLTDELIKQPEFLKVLRYLRELGVYEKFSYLNSGYPEVPDFIWEKLDSLET